MKLGRFVLQRLVYFAVGLILVISVAFLITRVLPGDPSYFLAGPFADEDAVAAVRADLGLDESIPTQYADYMKQLAHGDLGSSIRTRQPVVDDIQARLPATLELGGTAGLLALLWAVPLGVYSAYKRGSILDRFGRGLSSVGVAMPEFWLGMILVLVFFTKLGIAPAPLGRIAGPAPDHVTGFFTLDSILTGNWPAFGAAAAQLILPAVTLGIIAGAPIMRVTRTFMLEVLETEYVRAARALGVPPTRILWRHAFPNVIVPVSAMMVIIFGWVLGGSVLVEYVFAWPGIGKYAVDSISASDYQPVMAVLIVSAITYLVLYLLTDIFHLFVDPRTRA